MNLATLLIAASSVALILFVSFIASRLVRSRRAGFSIRMQIFLALAFIVGAFAFGLGVLVLDRVKARATLLAEESARSEAAAIAGLVRNEVEVRGKSLAEVSRDLASLQGEVGMSLLAPDGTPLFEAGLSPDEAGVVSVTAPIVARGELVGSVRVVKPTIVIQRTLADFAPTVLVISVVLGVAAAIAAATIGRTIASPIEKLTVFAVRVSEGQLLSRPPAVHGREVTELADALESMRRELEGRPFVETFAADLSHELKNPVAAIRASAEVLADGALEEPKEAEKFVARIREAVSRIEALLGELLSLARIEARGVREAATVDLGDLAREAVERARERGSDVSLTSVSAPVRGDAMWLSRMLDNLLDNAHVHAQAPAEGGVRVELREEAAQFVLSVHNRGAVPEHVRARLFKRFVTTRAEHGGTGLGLAIARAVAEAHGGAIACSRLGPPEVTFRVTLPRDTR